MAQLQEKVGVVTGAGSGIGRGIALAFAAAGARVVLAARGRERLEAVVQEIRGQGGQALVVPTDVGREEEVVALFKRAHDEYGRVDILVNNAAAFDGGPLEDISYETWQKVVDVNLTGSFLCAREAMRLMKPQGGGRIINVGSISAQMPREENLPYTTTKHAITGLTKSIALEGREHGVLASSIHPGNVLTEWRQDKEVAMHQEPMMSVDQVTKVVMTMVTLDPDVNLLEAIVLPAEQLYLGRG
jgi:NAD(P)-dependent dehydrogenase (short-subunit alcohol dehydrogenase family)